jgi:hypothetical protein
MNHKGVEYTVVKSDTTGFWHWQFRIGEEIKTGRTETNIELLAMRRAQLKINQVLNGVARGGGP